MATQKPLVLINGRPSVLPTGDTLEGVSGGGGSQQVFVQQTRPAGLGPWAWYQTDADGNIIDLIIADGNP